MYNSKCIEKTITVSEPVEKVWWRWTRSEGLLTFFGSENNIELRLGGPYEILFLMENPPGTQGGEGNKVLGFLPNRMLSFTWNCPPHFTLVRNAKHKTWVVLLFEELEGGQTAVNLYHYGWPEKNNEDWNKEWYEVYAYFENAWDSVLQSLEKSIK